MQVYAHIFQIVRRLCKDFLLIYKDFCPVCDIVIYGEIFLTHKLCCTCRISLKQAGRTIPG